jgi:hypothetical protein
MIDVSGIAPGTRLRIVGDLVAQVVQNMNDGEWLRVRLVQQPETPGGSAPEELCHATDVLEVL